MKLFFAGNFDNRSNDYINTNALIKNRLYSFATEKVPARNWKHTLLLDSGAFTEFTTGKQIHINELIQFIKDTKPWNAIQLDKIGDEEETWNRYLYMKSKGVKPLPVIPRDSTKKHIERVLTLSQDYICLGGLVPISGIRDRPKLIAWLDYLYREYPNIRNKKVHCLGIMQKVILQRYPFYSADSSSWLSVFRYPIAGQNIDRMRQIGDKTKTKSRYEVVSPYIEKQLQMEKHLTDLWTKRGFTWKD
jgi:hypothetical protein